MNEFAFYLGEGDVKKRRKDMELAKSLLIDAQERLEKASKLDFDDFAKMIFENVYDAMRALLDALLAVDGYKSYSHEASIVYLKIYGFDMSIITELDGFRALRNSSKYYGKPISSDNARDIVDFYRKNSEQIRKIIEDKLT